MDTGHRSLIGRCAAGVVGIAVLLSAAGAQASTFGFSPLPGSGGGSAGGSTSYFVDIEPAGVSASGAAMVSFAVRSAMSSEGVITALAFEHTGQLGSLVQVYNGPGAAMFPSFVSGEASAGKSVAAQVRSSLAASNCAEGVNAGEYARFVFELAPGVTHEGVVEAFAARQVQIGLTASGDQDGSGDFVSVPSPGSVALLAAGVVCVLRGRRHDSKAIK